MARLLNLSNPKNSPQIKQPFEHSLKQATLYQTRLYNLPRWYKARVLL